MEHSALVTGAAGRIGKAFALALAQMGYHIFLHYNTSRAKAEDTRKLIEETGQGCMLMQANFTKEKEVSELIKNCQEKGSIEVLVNNASRFVKSDITNEGATLLDDLFRINFKAPYILTKQFARHCQKGLIINMLDTKINQHQTEHLDYVLTKKSLEDFTYLSARQLGPDIRVNGIAPGLILAPEGESETYLQKKSKDIPLQRSGTLEQLTNTLRFLINNAFVTGEVICVDGGEHLMK